MTAKIQSAPPKISTPSLKLFATAALALAGMMGGAILFFFDPAKNNFYPICQFHALTGLNCPGCGMTRAAFQLLHGNFLAAMHDNALFIFALAALAARGLWFLKRKTCNQSVNLFISPKAMWMFLIIALIFAVLRNLPAFAWLSPA